MQTEDMNITPYDLACRFKGIKEIRGPEHNSQIVAILQRAVARIKSDEVAWCSAFVNYICWLLDLEQTNHLRARSWLRVGESVPLWKAKPGWDIVIFNRADGPMDINIINAPGHVGFYHSHNWKNIQTLGGNQKNSVNITKIRKKRLLGVRRLHE